MLTSARRWDWKVTTLCVIAAWCVLFARLVPGLVFDWSDSGDFSHGFLVPVFSGFLLWMRRREWARARSAPDLKGLWLIAGALLVHLAGVAASELYLQRTAMVPFLLGWILLLEGKERVRLLLFPILFLLFMIPPPTIFWSSISLPLQLMATRAAEGSLQLAGIPAVREGNILHLQGCSLEVASACSGIRSLVTLLALATVIAEGSVLGRGVALRSAPAKLILVLSAVPLAVGVNTLRVTSAAFLASRAGIDTVDRFHDVSGIVMFVVALAALSAWRRFLRWIEERSLPRPALS
jgi:exosortase